MEKQQKLYGFYTKNILLQETYLQKIQGKQKPGTFSRLWNWKPKKDYLVLQLLREWSIHGMKYIVQPERHIFERIFWAIMVLSSTGVACFFSYEIVKKYLSSPVIVSFQPSQTSVSEVPFPGVTFCNVNHFKKSALQEAINNIMEAAANNADPSTVVGDAVLLKELNHLCEATKSFSSRFNFSRDETSLMFLRENKALLKYLAQVPRMSVEETRLPKYRKRLENAVQSCEDMIHLCIWEGEEFECGKSFMPVLTDFGMCCSFNMMPTWILLNADEPTEEHEKNISAEENKSWKKFNLDGALMDDDDSHEKGPNFPRHQSKAGQSSGLSVLLYPGIPEYFCSTHDAYGFRIFAHSSIEFPHVLEYGLAVGPNKEMFVNVQAEVTVAEEDIRGLTTEERHCYFLKEKALANYAHYTSSNCIDECIMNRTVAKCGCVTFDMYQSTKNKTDYCENVDCAVEVRKEIGRKGTKNVCKKCYPSCNRILYSSHTSSLPIREDINIWKSADAKRIDWSNQNISIVHVYFGSDSVYTRVRKRLVGFSELFANVGGILGLFIGFSVISLVEPIYFLVRICRFYFTKTKDEDETLVENYE